MATGGRTRYPAGTNRGAKPADRGKRTWAPRRSGRTWQSTHQAGWSKTEAANRAEERQVREPRERETGRSASKAGAAAGRRCTTLGWRRARRRGAGDDARHGTSGGFGNPWDFDKFAGRRTKRRPSEPFRLWVPDQRTLWRRMAPRQNGATNAREDRVRTRTTPNRVRPIAAGGGTGKSRSGPGAR